MDRLGYRRGRTALDDSLMRSGNEERKGLLSFFFNQASELIVIPFVKRNTEERTGEVIWFGKLRVKLCFDLLKFETPVGHPRSVSRLFGVET